MASQLESITVKCGPHVADEAPIGLIYGRPLGLWERVIVWLGVFDSITILETVFRPPLIQNDDPLDNCVLQAAVAVSG